ncbi:MAG: hypothetical protein JRI68_08400 [Deltaproteobacteria bacterium]|nr:hypothetical protein [Deltaproteobacteria bacterium]
MSQPPPEPAAGPPCATCGAPSYDNQNRCPTCIGSEAFADALDATQAIRTQICSQCAAPVVVPKEGATLACPCCGQSVSIRRLSFERLQVPWPEGSRGGQDDRAALFRAALRSLDRCPYELSLPEVIAGRDLVARGTLHDLHEAFRAACQPLQARAQRRHGGGAYRQAADALPELAEAEHEVCSIAHWALELSGIGQRWLRARPLLEQAYELCSDPGFRQLMLCDLARLAEEVGRLEAAEQWLSGCDPKPPQIDLASTTRYRRARLAARRGQWDEVLQAAGHDLDGLPITRALQIPMGLLRVAAFERLAQADQADQAMKALADVHLVADIAEALGRADLLAPARAAWERLRARWEIEDQRKRRTAIVKGLALVGVGFAAILGSAALLWNGRMSTLECERPRAEPAATTSEQRPTEATAAPSCHVHESLIGKRVDSYPVEGLRSAIVNTSGRDTKKKWSVVVLMTEQGSRELCGCTNCEAALKGLAMRINHYLGDADKRRLFVVEPSENPAPLIAFGGAVAGVAMMLLGLGRALKARFSKPVRA